MENKWQPSRFSQPFLNNPLDNPLYYSVSKFNICFYTACRFIFEWSAKKKKKEKNKNENLGRPCFLVLAFMDNQSRPPNMSAGNLGIRGTWLRPTFLKLQTAVLLALTCIGRPCFSVRESDWMCPGFCGRSVKAAWHEFRRSPAFVPCGLDWHSLDLRLLYPRALTCFGRAWFIAWHPRRLF